MVAFDMCVMASSDHSILTIGTFGQSCALLAGGDVVAVTGLSQELDTWVGLTRDISSPHYIMLLGGPGLPQGSHGQLGLLECARC